MGNTIEKSTGESAARRLRGKQILSQSTSFLGLAVMVLLFSVLTQGKLIAPTNLELIVKQGFTLFLASLAGVFIMATGNLDFSLGANIGFSCAICATAAQVVPPAAAVAIAIVAGALVGAINGLVITKLRLPSFITCLCMMFILTAITQTLCGKGGSSIPMPLSMRKWESLTLYAILGIIYFAVMLVMFRYTRFGKYMKALGVSPEAARQSGVGVNKMIFLGYLLTGLAAGLAGFLTMIRTGGATSTTGQTMTTDVIIAIVFGGMSISGGATSKISAAVLGTLIVTTLNNGMVLAGYGGEIQQLVKGILFLIIIAISTKRDSNTIIK